MFGERIRRARSSVQIDKREFVVFPDHRLGNKNMQGYAAKIYQGKRLASAECFPTSATLCWPDVIFDHRDFSKTASRRIFLIYIATRALPVQ